MHKNKVLAFLIDGGSLGLAVIIDLVLNIVTLQTIGYDLATKVGMISLAFLVVLFGLRALIKGHRLLWFGCAVLSVFFSLSFALLTTSTQSSAGGFVSGSDAELQRLTANADKEAATLAQLRIDREAAVAKANRDSIDQSIIRQEPVAASAEAARKTRFDWIEQQRLAGATYIPPPLTANALFEAIPRTIGIPLEWLPPMVNWIKLAVFALLFVIMQGTIVVSAQEAIINKENPNGIIDSDQRIRGSYPADKTTPTNAPQTPLPKLEREDPGPEAAPAPTAAGSETQLEEVQEVRPDPAPRDEPPAPGVQSSHPAPDENLRRFARIALETWPHVMSPDAMHTLTGKDPWRMQDLHDQLVTLKGPVGEWLFEHDDEDPTYRYVALFGREIVDAALKGGK